MFTGPFKPISSTRADSVSAPRSMSWACASAAIAFLGFADQLGDDHHVAVIVDPVANAARQLAPGLLGLVRQLRLHAPLDGGRGAGDGDVDDGFEVGAGDSVHAPLWEHIGNEGKAGLHLASTAFRLQPGGLVLAIEQGARMKLAC